MEKKKKSSEKDQLTGHFQIFFPLIFLCVFLISPEQSVKQVK